MDKIHTEIADAAHKTLNAYDKAPAAFRSCERPHWPKWAFPLFCNIFDRAKGRHVPSAGARSRFVPGSR